MQIFQIKPSQSPPGFTPQFGSEHYSNIGKRGGQKTAERHGREYFRRIGDKGRAKIRELIAKGKAALE